MQRSLFAAIFAGAMAAAGFANAQGRSAAAGQCSECHDQARKMAGTAHASLACLICHPGHRAFPHPVGIAEPECAGCHQNQSAENQLGVHGRARAKGNQAAPDCGVCHGGAHEVQKTGTEAFRESIPGICGMCHDQVLAQYQQSVHGKAAAAGIVAAPVCSTCHGEHGIQPPTSATSPVNPLHIPETCGRCHGNVQLAREFNFPRDTLVSYEASFHGLELNAGSETVANCASCHGVHEILASSDPRSTINPRNLPKTCGKCHPGAGTRFAIGRIHWVAGQAEPAAVRGFRVGYQVLIPLVLGLMLLHSLGDWTHKLFRLRLRPSPAPRGYAGAPPLGQDATRFRMYRFERVEHGILVLCFTVLVWSGFALKYPDQWWARPLLLWESGWSVRGTVHRTAGAILIGLALAHVVSLATSGRLRRHWKSLWPRHADVSEAAGTFAYNLGLRRTAPRLSPHSYVEKAEYWSVVWGTALMAATGVLLWANAFVLRWLPKVVLDVAATIHFYEAMLAALAIVVWHFYVVIFDPEVYPVDPAWLTGYSVRNREAEGADDNPEGEPGAPKS